MNVFKLRMDWVDYWTCAEGKTVEEHRADLRDACTAFDSLRATDPEQWVDVTSDLEMLDAPGDTSLRVGTWIVQWLVDNRGYRCWGPDSERAIKQGFYDARYRVPLGAGAGQKATPADAGNACAVPKPPVGADKSPAGLVTVEEIEELLVMSGAVVASRVAALVAKRWAAAAEAARAEIQRYEAVARAVGWSEAINCLPWDYLNHELHRPR